MNVAFQNAERKRDLLAVNGDSPEESRSKRPRLDHNNSL